MIRSQFLLIFVGLGISGCAVADCIPTPELTTSWGWNPVLVEEPKAFKHLRRVVTDIYSYRLAGTPGRFPRPRF